MRRQGGFSYLIVMFLVAVSTIVSVRALENTLTAERRDKEAELLYVGQAYREAIRSYYDNSPGTAKEYPDKLESLLEDKRTTSLRRHLRKLYRDPITGGTDWGIVSSASGTVMGVYSLSTLEPFKKDGFAPGLGGFVNAKQYKNWLFVYQPN